MIQKYTRYKILLEFFDYPTKDFHMREISRRTKITQPSVINHLNALIKEGLIIKEKKDIYPTYRSNRDNELFRLYKKTNIMLRLKQSGLLDFLNDSCQPDTIVLFGSSSNGDDIEESDIDLFIQSPEKKFNLSSYEKKLNRKISLFFEKNFSRLSSELKNNIINGMILKGYLKVF
ncbi:MAG: ArsR family transcriptional regulator [Nanoarchaeota archaeon]